ncbi:hypothetical protein BDV12DRAFT_34923 [Aspergillus spectabilis]
MSLTDPILLLLYLGHTSSRPSWAKAPLTTTIILFIFLTLLALLFMLTRTLFTTRALVSLSNQSTPQTILGKPLLFPVTFNHTRLSPTKDKFTNRFLLLGIPVGITCRIGNLLAIDNPSLQDASPPPGGGGIGFWRRSLAHLRCWFSVDAVRLLHRGDYGVGLRGKLDSFLRSQNEDPSQWPHAYLLTVPKFLGFSRSVVSWWYLYNAERELDALILEINNSYDEKRNIFLRLKPSSATEKLSPPPPPSKNTIEYLDNSHLLTSLPTHPTSKFYTGTWHKQIFASPFEKVDGLVSQRMMDPLSPPAWKSTSSFSNMTTLEESGEVRMATRLTCASAPIDPTMISSWALARFLIKWTVPGIFTTAEIVVKALKIRFSGKMKMNKKPPVRSGSVGRHISKLELDLESFFRTYLSHAITSHPDAIHLTYLPCRSFSNKKIHLRSPSCLGKNPSSIQHVTIEPTDPGFYTRFVNYPDMKTAVTEETREMGFDADPTASRLLVSDMDQLRSILESGNRKEKVEIGRGSWKDRILLSLARGFAGLTVMDEFILSSRAIDPSARTVYICSILKLSAAKAIAFNSPKLLTIYTLVTSSLLKWFLLDFFSTLCAKSGSPFVSFSAGILGLDYSGTRTVDILVGYGLVTGVWTMIKGWILR